MVWASVSVAMSPALGIEDGCMRVWTRTNVNVTVHPSGLLKLGGLVESVGLVGPLGLLEGASQALCVLCEIAANA